MASELSSHVEPFASEVTDFTGDETSIDQVSSSHLTGPGHRGN